MTKADRQILECIDARTSFLLDAGAGSGKTSSLIGALNHIRAAKRTQLLQSSQHIACITFTNVAKDEIIDRTENDTILHVSTIHDFLWRAIRGFQKDLKEALLAFNNELPAQSRRKQDAGELRNALAMVDAIRYSDLGANFIEGRIFHDDLLGIAHAMFRSHPKLSQIVASKYPYILVDEYQDTNEKVICILMEHLFTTKNAPVLGFFGDKFQSIYSEVIGEMPAKFQALLRVIKKEENYRCSRAVIRLLNRIRTDIQQVPAGENSEGSACYLNLPAMDQRGDLIAAAMQAVQKKFGADFGTDPKTLFLTHRLIARRAGYETLWNVYNTLGSFSRERFQSGQDPVASFLCDPVDKLISAWGNGRRGYAIAKLVKTWQRETSAGATESRRNLAANLAEKSQKQKVQNTLDTLIPLANSGASIHDVLKILRDNALIPLLDDLEQGMNENQPPAEPGSPEEEHQVFMASLLNVPYREISLYRAVLEDNLPYSTKHGVKGAEFDNVLVILDDAGANWNQYSFSRLLTGSETNDARLRRTRNLFYVCCSRAKVNLAVVDLGVQKGNRQAIEQLFGSGNVAF